MTPYAPYPLGRPRRLRFDDFTRRMVRENQVTPDDFIYPVFLHEGSKRRQAVASMPGVERLSIDLLLPVAERCMELGVPCIDLFPAIDTERKDADGSEALYGRGWYFADGMMEEINEDEDVLPLR